MSFRLRVAYVGAYCSFTSSEHWFHAHSYSEKEFSITDVLNPPGSTTATLQPNGFRERLHNQQAASLMERDNILRYFGVWGNFGGYLATSGGKHDVIFLLAIPISYNGDEISRLSRLIFQI